MDIAEAERLIRKCKNVARQMGDQRLEKKYKSRAAVEKLVLMKAGEAKMKSDRDTAGLEKLIESTERMHRLVSECKNNSRLMERLFSLVYTNLPTAIQDRVLEFTDGEQDVKKMVEKLQLELTRLEAHDVAVIKPAGQKEVASKEPPPQAKKETGDKDTCRFCHEPGHFARNCKELKEHTCKSCNKKGHSAKFCSNKESKQYWRPSSVYDGDTSWRKPRTGKVTGLQDDKPRCTVTVGGTEAPGIVDTGADVTMLPEAVVKTDAPWCTFTMADGKSTMFARGPVVRTFAIDGEEAHHPVYVIGGGEANIGAGVLKKLGAVVDLANGTVRFNTRQADEATPPKTKIDEENDDAAEEEEDGAAEKEEDDAAEEEEDVGEEEEDDAAEEEEEGDAVEEEVDAEAEKKEEEDDSEKEAEEGEEEKDGRWWELVK